MKRYTGKSLEQDVAGFNTRLESLKHEYRIVVEYYNGYTHVALATPEQVGRHCTQRKITGGNPRECLNACYAYLAGLLQ